VTVITPSEEDPLLTAQEVAKIFAVRERTVRDWINEGKITAVKLNGQHWRIQRSEMVRFANEKYGDSQN
jgi:excisionase family DNA binding protein